VLLINLQFLGTRSTSHMEGGNLLKHQCATPPGWCDGSHIAPECPTH